ncbi:RNA-directed DNA polymerase, eukaryota, reverse transcriptase zinc-binding domain protein [Tanacetum coccineum]
MSRVHAWNEVIDRVKNRLSKWKMKTLSIGGRLTLLKSVLGSIPIFHMSIYRAHLSVLRTLEFIRSKFFKGHDINSNKASWVNWKKVLASKEKGGLGVSSLFALNRGLMFKWIWRFYTQNTLLWVRVVKAIHGDDGNVGGHVKSGAKSCWLDIVRETHALKTKGINLLDCMHVKLGNGDKTIFWEDIWIDGKTLKNRFPHIYSLESCKLITVGAKLAQPSLEYSFRRNPRGGVEQDQFNELSALVHDVSLIHMSDRWKWDLESSGDFSVASGGLQYLTFTRLDLSYAVQQGTLELGLQLYASATTSLVGYTDAGYYVFLEYQGVANVVAKTAWIRNLLRELHSPLLTATLVYCDNVSAVCMSANPVQHQRTKHIKIDIHFVRDMVKAGHVRVLHVPSRFQYADIFTKGLSSALFEDFCSSLSVRPPPALLAFKIW